MKYLGSTPNRMFFLIILLIAMFISCSRSKTLIDLGRQLFNAVTATAHADASEMPT